MTLVPTQQVLSLLLKQSAVPREPLQGNFKFKNIIGEVSKNICPCSFSRMLVIIVSLGFGIVKPRLGPTMHRVLAIGGLYFVIATAEAFLRIIRPKNDTSSVMMMAGVPLAVIDR